MSCDYIYINRKRNYIGVVMFIYVYMYYYTEMIIDKKKKIFQKLQYTKTIMSNFFSKIINQYIKFIT